MTHTSNETEQTHGLIRANGDDAVIDTDGRAAGSLGRCKIPGDTVYKATADLPDNQRSAIRWLHSYASEHDLSIGDIAEKIRYSPAIVSLIFRGQYQAKLDAVIQEIEAFKNLEEQRSTGRKLQFVNTALATQIFNLCHAAREFQRIAYIFSDSQVGKSEALIEYTRQNNHGNTIYIAVPTRGTLIHFIAKLGKILRIPAKRGPDLRQRIIEAFDDRMLLVVDECHRCAPEGGATPASLQTIEFIREIHDERKCGVVLCGTNVFRDAIEQGDWVQLLRQARRRRMAFLQLPSEPTKKDLNTFAAAYGLPHAEGQALELQTRIIRDEALGMWLMLLRMASKLAQQRKHKMTWADVISAEVALCELEGRKK